MNTDEVLESIGIYKEEVKELDPKEVTPNHKFTLT